MRRPLMTIAGAGLAAALLIGGGAAFWYERPTTLTVAVSRLDSDDGTVMAAAQALLKHEHKPVRLRPVMAESASDAAAAVDAGKVDLAVIRSDVALPANAQTVVILHRDAAIIVTPASSDVKDLDDLPGHRIGILRDGPANTNLLNTLLAQFEIKPDAVTTESLQPGEIADAIRNKRVDAVMMVDVVSSPAVHDAVKAVATAGGGPPNFIPVSEADAIAQRSPVYESTQITKGAFGGSPSRPADEYDTLSITHRLVANENIDQGPIADLTRFLLGERSTLAVTAPLARRIEAPSTDKGSALPVHAGAAAYIDDEEETFFDKYSDMIYMGAMMLGVVASGATALLSRMNAEKSAALEASIARLIEMVAAVRNAGSIPNLDDYQGEADSLLTSALARAGSSEDGGRIAVFSLVLDQVHNAIRDRRAVLSGTTPMVAANSAGYPAVSAAAE